MYTCKYFTSFQLMAENDTCRYDHNFLTLLQIQRLILLEHQQGNSEEHFAQQAKCDAEYCCNVYLRFAIYFFQSENCYNNIFITSIVPGKR